MVTAVDDSILRCWVGLYWRPGENRMEILRRLYSAVYSARRQIVCPKMVGILGMMGRGKEERG